MRNVFHIAFNTYRETVRDKVLYNLVLFALVMIASSYILSQISIYQGAKIIKDLGLASIEVFGVVIAIFIGIGLVSKEIDKRSLYSLLPKPVSRVQFLLGKYFGLLFTLAVNVAVMSMGLYALLLSLGDGFDPGLAKAIYLIYWELALITAIALLFSTFSSSVLSGVFAGFFFVAGKFATELKHVETVVESPFVPKVTEVLYFLLPNLKNFDVKNQVVHGDAVPRSLLGFSTAYGLLYIGMALLAAVLIFRKRNLK